MHGHQQPFDNDDLGPAIIAHINNGRGDCENFIICNAVVILWNYGELR
jgi:hypothetical protein